MSTRARAGALLALACLFPITGRLAIAGPSDHVFTPAVEEGEREVEFKAGSARARDGSRLSQQSLAFGYGVNAWWFTEVAALWHKEPGERHGFDAWEWENRLQFTETGKYPVDLGLVIEIERPKDRREGYELTWGPLLQAELGSLVQANLNLLFSRHLRAAEGGKAELGYQWQLKARWRPAFEFGLQGFGALGPWNDWAPSSQQSHVAGPALFGRLRVADHQVLHYNLAWLLGHGSGSPKNTVRLQLEYEF